MGKHKEKEIKTNAMRILEKNKIPYEVLQYECDEFIGGLHTAQKTGAPVEQSFKTLRYIPPFVFERLNLEKIYKRKESFTISARSCCP